MNADSNSQNNGMFQVEIEFNAVFCFVMWIENEMKFNCSCFETRRKHSSRIMN